MSEGATISAPAASVREGLVGQDCERGVVRDFTVFHDAAMAVVGVFAEADVCDDDELEVGFTDGFHCALDYSGAAKWS